MKQVVKEHSHIVRAKSEPVPGWVIAAKMHETRATMIDRATEQRNARRQQRQERKQRQAA